MKHELPELPYAATALEPHVSAETLQYHHGKHHAKYVSTLNELLPGSGLENDPLEEVVRKSSGKLFNQAAQAWNHDFYWKCLSPDGGGEPKGPLAEAIEKKYGGFDQFKEQFATAAATLFGSGWVWLVKDPDGGLDVRQTGNAETPIRDGGKPVLTCDVWEHAYYIDYRNARPKYIDAFWKLVNWDFAARQYEE